MQAFLSFLVALVVTMTLIPPLMRASEWLHVMDVPGGRKIHTRVVPRIGGIAMVLGFLVPVLFWSQFDRLVESLLAGLCILFVFGVWDDRKDLDHRVKLAGQLAAVLVVVFYGQVSISVVPFLGLDPANSLFSIPLTVIFLLGITNAINLADGPDGLAAGMTFLSLVVIGFLAYRSDGMQLVIMTVAAIGVIMGFLRFNTYPARIFMGDSGSQFLGFTSGVLAVVLTQQLNPALNPALPLLLLGLPAFDTLFVIAKRLYYGSSPFTADKNHIHHQLLSLHFDHYEAVVIIYVVQAAFVLSAVIFRYQSDLFILSWDLFLNLVLTVTLVKARRAGWRAHQHGGQSRLVQAIVNPGAAKYMYSVPLNVVRILVPLMLVVGSLTAKKVPADIGIAAIPLFLLLLVRLIYGYKVWFLLLRLLVFVCVAFVLYLVGRTGATVSEPAWVGIQYLYYGVLLMALIAAIRHSAEDVFRVTPTDYLFILVVVGMGFLPHSDDSGNYLVPLVIKVAVLFYACELIMRNMQSRVNGMTLSALWALGVIAVRGVVSG
jgi:UDP-GlcNAc:undecaprenyl-phosphate GlcNAc-1-phosphate transferase